MVVDLGGKVGLVGDKDLFFAFIGFDLFLIVAGHFFAGVEDVEDEFGLGDALMTAANAFGLDGIGGLAEAGGVNENDGDAADVGGFLDGVTCGAGGGGDNGAVGTEQLVQEAGFSGIGASDNDCTNAMAENATFVGSGEQLVNGGEDILEAGEELGEGVGGDVFVGEIDVGLYVGEGLHEVVAQLGDALAETAGELLVGSGEGEVSASVDEITDGFSLGKVDAAVDEGAPGEFAGLGAASTSCENGF